MSSNRNSEKKISLLKVHEWLAIAIIIGVLAGITCLTSFSRNANPYSSTSNTFIKTFGGFDVLVKGAVSYPGIYHFETEVTIKEALDRAGITFEADLSRIKLDTVLKSGCVIKVPQTKKITVYIKGAVQQEEKLVLSKGTRVEELIDRVVFAPDANIKVLKRKRRLKHNEVVDVPIQKSRVK